MATTPRSRKQKGSSFQKKIAEDIRKTFNLEEHDVISTPNSVTGVDILMSERALSMFQFGIECKAQEALNTWKALEQAESNCPPELVPLLVFKRNRSKTYAALEWEYFLAIIRAYKAYQILCRKHGIVKPDEVVECGVDSKEVA